MKRLLPLMILVMAVAFLGAETAQAQYPDQPGLPDPYYLDPPQDIDTFHANVDYCIARGKSYQVCLSCGYKKDAGGNTIGTVQECIGIRDDGRCQCTNRRGGGCQTMTGYCDWRMYG